MAAMYPVWPENVRVKVPVVRLYWRKIMSFPPVNATSPAAYNPINQSVLSENVRVGVVPPAIDH
jgi:hypothetical protein